VIAPALCTEFSYRSRCPCGSGTRVRARFALVHVWVAPPLSLEQFLASYPLAVPAAISVSSASVLRDGFCGAFALEILFGTVMGRKRLRK
jgi:hypothetical protein